MKKLVIIKTGDSIPELCMERGDFEDWILNGLQQESSVPYKTISVHRNETLPALDKISGIAITGSHEMITDNPPWCRKACAWIKHAIELKIPILGICFGHQMLAEILGGRVDYNPNGPEYGTAGVSLTENAAADSLFKDFSEKIEVQMSHSQSVIKLPENTVRLASSTMDPNSAFRFENHVWGIQFHPEYDAHIASEYIKDYNKNCDNNSGKSALSADCRESSAGQIILKNFSTLLNNN